MHCQIAYPARFMSLRWGPGEMRSMAGFLCLTLVRMVLPREVTVETEVARVVPDVVDTTSSL